MSFFCQCVGARAPVKEGLPLFKFRLGSFLQVKRPKKKKNTLKRILYTHFMRQFIFSNRGAMLQGSAAAESATEAGAWARARIARAEESAT